MSGDRDGWSEGLGNGLHKGGGKLGDEGLLNSSGLWSIGYKSQTRLKQLSTVGIIPLQEGKKAIKKFPGGVLGAIFPEF